MLRLSLPCVKGYCRDSDLICRATLTVRSIESPLRCQEEESVFMRSKRLSSTLTQVYTTVHKAFATLLDRSYQFSAWRVDFKCSTLNVSSVIFARKQVRLQASISSLGQHALVVTRGLVTGSALSTTKHSQEWHNKRNERRQVKLRCKRATCFLPKAFSLFICQQFASCSA